MMFSILNGEIMENKLKLADPGLFMNRAFLDGEWVTADNEATIPVTDPATGEVLAHVPSLGAAETERAIAAAQEAQRKWQTKSGKERANILRAWHDAMMANLEDLALLMTREQGKPLAESRGEIAYAASFIEWIAEEAKRI